MRALSRDETRKSLLSNYIYIFAKPKWEHQKVGNGTRKEGTLPTEKKQNSPVKCEIERGKRVRKTEKRTLKQREGSFILSIYF